MSIEPDPVPTSDDPPVDPIPPTPDPVPDDPDPTPPPPPDPVDPITVEPGTWYEVTSVCTTSTCPNLNTTTTEPMVYSNAGTIVMICGRCGHRRPILAVTKLDPQPVMD